MQQETANKFLNGQRHLLAAVVIPIVLVGKGHAPVGDRPVLIHHRRTFGPHAGWCGEGGGEPRLYSISQLLCCYYNLSLSSLTLSFARFDSSTKIKCFSTILSRRGIIFLRAFEINSLFEKDNILCSQPNISL